MSNAPETRLLVRVVTVIIAVCAATAVHAGMKPGRQLAAILRHTPAAQIVAEGEQMKSAEQAAAAIAGAQTFWGVGTSMQPLYAPSTAVVVSPIAYDDIKKGMTLVYTRHDGSVVAHSVVDEDGQGYVVQGVNNDEPDRESVNEENLVGVVVAAYSTSETDLRRTFGRQLAARDLSTTAGHNS